MIWLKDFLPYQLQSIGTPVSVWSFGYDSRIALTKSASGITEIATMLLGRLDKMRRSDEERRRPIIFISHSLGGIIVKKVSKHSNLRTKLSVC